MNKIEEQVTSALRRQDAKLTVHDELDAIINNDHIVRFSSQRDTPIRRPLLAIAAAAVLVVGAGGLIWAQRTEPAAPATADAPQPAVSDPAPSVTLTAPETTVPEPVDPAMIAANESACRDGLAETTVPNVGGMAYFVAVEALRAAGLDSLVAREGVSGVVPELGDRHVILWQDPTPGSPIACGDVVELTATSLPVYVVQPGDTWESVAAAQAIPVEDLLDFNDFSIAELEADGGSATSPIEIGRVLRLSLPDRPLLSGPAATTTVP
jgi:hypothetical protein